MARYTGPKNKLSRREGYNLFGSTSRSLERRLNVPPGEHGMKRRRKVSEYGLQLREKQKVKRLYGMMERQFRRFFDMASRQTGVTGEVLLQLLERRLDNVVYRLGFARTRPMARQVVAHGHVLVNGHKVDVGSYLVRPGETISLAEKSYEIPGIQDAMADRAGSVPPWLARDDRAGRVLRLPDRAEVEPGITEQLIVEFYSR
ncbi:MAG: 30S ribosomal protein S4 [Chloroflexi bacterium]|nr:30S ribosomal protein S4 [Chloroflexota bacterium]MCL5109718.1 30S ribosomal protein S4 [Chloroflexota bacterium]